MGGGKNANNADPNLPRTMKTSRGLVVTLSPTEGRKRVVSLNKKTKRQGTDGRDEPIKREVAGGKKRNKTNTARQQKPSSADAASTPPRAFKITTANSNGRVVKKFNVEKVVKELDFPDEIGEKAERKVKCSHCKRSLALSSYSSAQRR